MVAVEPAKTFKRLNDMMRDIGEEEHTKKNARPKTAAAKDKSNEDDSD